MLTLEPSVPSPRSLNPGAPWDGLRAIEGWLEAVHPLRSPADRTELAIRCLSQLPALFLPLWHRLDLPSDFPVRHKRRQNSNKISAGDRNYKNTKRIFNPFFCIRHYWYFHSYTLKQPTLTIPNFFTKSNDAGKAKKTHTALGIQ